MIWPMLIAAGTAILVLLVDLVTRRWAVPWTVGVLGALGTAVSAVLVPSGQYSLLCADEGRCSYVLDDPARLFTVLIAALTAFCLLLFAPALRSGDTPAGEAGFLIACAMTGGVVLAGARDLLTLIVALETLTLPLYAMVALHRKRAGVGASASITFFTTSIVATAVTLLGAALLNLSTGTIHLPQALAPTTYRPLAIVGLILMLTGLGFKVAAVPMHAWAPSTYDGAPVPIAAYLSTASKLGGVVAILYVTDAAIKGGLVVPAGITMAVLATASLLVGTLVALLQQRTVRLLAWSSVAQAGFILAPLGGLIGTRSAATAEPLLAASVAYTIFFLALELAAFSGVAALRRGPADGGELDDLTGLGRTAPWPSAMLAIALIGLAGLPPALAGLFAKITVLRVLIDVQAIWLAVVVALVSIIGLAVYWRPLAALYRAPRFDSAPTLDLTAALKAASNTALRPVSTVEGRSWTAMVPLTVATLVTAVLSVMPQLVLTLWP